MNARSKVGRANPGEGWEGRKDDARRLTRRLLVLHDSYGFGEHRSNRLMKAVPPRISV